MLRTLICVQQPQGTSIYKSLATLKYSSTAAGVTIIVVVVSGSPLIATVTEIGPGVLSGETAILAPKLTLKRALFCSVNPLKVTIDNYEEGKIEYLDAPNNVENEELGSRKIAFGKHLYIEQEDFIEEKPNRKWKRLSVGDEVRLMHAYFIKCESVVKDENGNIVEVDDLVSVYPQIIAPGEKAYYYNETTLDASSDLQCTLKPTIKAEKAKVPLVRYETSDFTISDEAYFGIKALGRITNTSDKDESLPYVTVFLYNSDNSLIGLISSVGSSIAAGETTAEEVNGITLPNDITTSVVDHIEVLAYPYQFQF